MMHSKRTAQDYPCNQGLLSIITDALAITITQSSPVQELLVNWSKFGSVFLVGYTTHIHNNLEARKHLPKHAYCFKSCYPHPPTPPTPHQIWMLVFGFQISDCSGSYAT